MLFERAALTALLDSDPLMAPWLDGIRRLGVRAADSGLELSSRRATDVSFPIVSHRAVQWREEWANLRALSQKTV